MKYSSVVRSNDYTSHEIANSLICSRYEKASIIFTSNKSYSKWGEIFQDSIIAAAFLDRVLHHCTTINIRGESYRMKEHMKKGYGGLEVVKKGQD